MTTSEPLVSASTAAQHLGNTIATEAESRLETESPSLHLSLKSPSAGSNYNLQHFAANYFFIVLGLSIYAVVTNWWLLFTIAFIFGGFYLISRQDGPITIGGNSISPSSLYAAYCGASLVLLLFSGATGTIFWIIGAAAIVILGHAALLEPGLENEFGADSQV
ncbi:hypothetical protein RO3G_02298 [Lichtheimia corymbifera JMRC:FSU:9682]|uniref:PRA1 family protein n=1 Tax=Lichtheimia corymbifera JMRC:FSU:9682 TaxID=1263082 RepID=A0A068RU55_9FUNG|nr:hypothetical protein RO3G_02298 [Lichtheimia corymbifera JMRC:FSU:9682]